MYSKEVSSFTSIGSRPRGANVSSHTAHVRETCVQDNDSGIHELELIFDNIISLFDSLGILGGVSKETKSSSRQLRKFQYSKESERDISQPSSPIYDIFQKQFQILSLSLERCRAYVIEDFIHIQKTYDDTLEAECNLEADLEALEETLGSRSYLSQDMTTPSPSPTLVQEDISEILALRDHLLSQLES